MLLLLRRHLAYSLYPEYKREIADLKDRNVDLHAEVQSLTSGGYVSQKQMSDLSRIASEHTTLSEQQNAIIVFLRDNDPDMLRGRYSTLSFSEMIISILREILQYRNGR